MNLALLRDAVRNRVGVPDNDAFFTDPQIDDFVNEALQAISVEVDWPWLGAATTFSTVSGTQGYAPPSDWCSTRVLSIDGSAPMEWRPLAEVRAAGTTGTGVPCHYTIHADAILLTPVPSGAYTVRHDYSVDEAELIGDGDTPLMPSQFHFSIVAYAAHLAFVRQADMNRAASALADYAGWKARMLGRSRRQSGPKRIRVYGPRAAI